jgi:hypothetical protein
LNWTCCSKLLWKQCPVSTRKHKRRTIDSYNQVRSRWVNKQQGNQKCVDIVSFLWKLQIQKEKGCYVPVTYIKQDQSYRAQQSPDNLSNVAFISIYDFLESPFTTSLEYYCLHSMIWKELVHWWKHQVTVHVNNCMELFWNPLQDQLRKHDWKAATPFYLKKIIVLLLLLLVVF